MAATRRQKLTIVLLLFYWPAIFILAHIPFAGVPDWFFQPRISDKAIHYLGYLSLVFLLWFAISPDKRVNWRRPAVWWVLLVVVWYGAVDEWLQGYVGRNCDVMDFFADLAGALTGLILLSIFLFWPACLLVTSAVIFILTNLIQAAPTDQLRVINTAFHLFAYAFFTLLWIQYMHRLLPIKPPQPKWLIGALTPPTAFLLATESFSAIAGNGFRLENILVSLAAIALVAAAFYFTAPLCKH